MKYKVEKLNEPVSRKGLTFTHRIARLSDVFYEVPISEGASQKKELFQPAGSTLFYFQDEETANETLAKLK